MRRNYGRAGLFHKSESARVLRIWILGTMDLQSRPLPFLAVGYRGQCQGFAARIARFDDASEPKG